MYNYVFKMICAMRNFEDHYLFRENFLLELRKLRSVRSVSNCLDPLIEAYPEHEDTIRECVAKRMKEVRLAYS